MNTTTKSIDRLISEQVSTGFCASTIEAEQQLGGQSS